MRSAKKEMGRALRPPLLFGPASAVTGQRCTPLLNNGVSVPGVEHAIYRAEVVVFVERVVNRIPSEKRELSRIGRQLQRRGKSTDLAERLAIEQALQTRGYLRQEIGGWC